jgi:hypothetical protein
MPKSSNLAVTSLSPRVRGARMEPPAAAQETVVGSVDETVGRREGSSVAVLVSFLLAGIGCVVLYVVVKRWLHRRAVARARQASEEMQRSPRHFTAEEYAPEPSTPTRASADQSPSPGPSPGPSPLQAAAVPRSRRLEAAAPRTQGPRAGRELGRRFLRARGAVPADGRQGRQLRLRHDVAQGGGRTCEPGWRAGTVTRPAWHVRGMGLARAWHVRGAGVARAWRGLGTGLAVAEPGSCWAPAPPWGRMAALGGPRPLPRVEPPRKPDPGRQARQGLAG